MKNTVTVNLGWIGKWTKSKYQIKILLTNSIWFLFSSQANSNYTSDNKTSYLLNKIYYFKMFDCINCFYWTFFSKSVTQKKMENKSKLGITYYIDEQLYKREKNSNMLYLFMYIYNNNNDNHQ